MRKLLVMLVVCALALAGCADDGAGPASPPEQGEAASQDSTTEGAVTGNSSSATTKAAGSVITVRDSQFGPMLFGSDRQAIYIFENDPEGRTVCYGECAEAWPPVLTDGEPQAGNGVKASLLGTVERRDGKLQVSYAGKPLYFYAHEGPGEVRCHNVNLNGGLWWAVGPDGRRRP